MIQANVTTPAGRVFVLNMWRDYAAMPAGHARTVAYWECVIALTRAPLYDVWKARRMLDHVTGW